MKNVRVNLEIKFDSLFKIIHKNNFEDMKLKKLLNDRYL